ncbi:hypothetical protein ACJIZ3_006220 [Penstemon smallii]|uniref:Uncharacterized protein n=1 Tax=Penstemon smallii TaxID=265156 RepID=A0ABD3S7D7_9LAMI
MVQGGPTLARKDTTRVGGIAEKFSYKKVVEDVGFVLGVLSYDSSCFSLTNESEIMKDSNWGTNVLIKKIVKMKCFDAIFNEILIWGYNLSNLGFRKYTHGLILSFYRIFERL